MTDHRQQLAADLIALGKHDLDAATMYCRRCGRAAMHIIDSEDQSCPATSNVHGITHRIAGRKLADLANRFFDQ